MSKLHAIFASGDGNVRTVCGKQGWRELVSNEWTDRIGNRFETVDEHHKATCGNCRRAMKLSPAGGRR